VVAEGVETQKQFNELRALDCDYWQGYYFSKPITASEATVLLEAQNIAPLIPPLSLE
jgi:EAL domain-containing protein (putative c-di-GMP-specific phosphodiesterase class I)